LAVNLDRCRSMIASQNDSVPHRKSFLPGRITLPLQDVRAHKIAALLNIGLLRINVEA
jgi:hypothetical protein